MPLEMNLFSETDRKTKNEHLKNVLCTVITNDESANISGIFQNTHFMLPMEKSVTFTGACANEIIPSINSSFVYKAKEG
jgi:hypothetical protein